MSARTTHSFSDDTDESDAEPGDVLEAIFRETPRTRMLRFLYQNSDTSFQQQPLAQRIDVTQPTVSRNKRPLLDHGLIEHTHSGLQITDRGEAIMDFLESPAVTDDE